MTMTIDRVLRLAELCRITGLSRSAIYQGERNGTFPASFKLGPRAKGWRASDVAAWIASGGASK